VLLLEGSGGRYISLVGEGRGVGEGGGRGRGGAKKEKGDWEKRNLKLSRGKYTISSVFQRKVYFRRDHH
jgi:hypothetical protein